MEIELYETFLIGIKLSPDLSPSFILRKLVSVLKEKDFTVPEVPKIPPPIKIGPPIELLGTKNEVEIKLNLERQAFNIIGDDPKEVMNIFEEFLPIFEESGFELDATVRYYELLAPLNIKTETSPLEALNGFCKIDFGPLAEITDITTLGLRIGSTRGSLEEKDMLNIIIEPNPASPNSRYLIRVNYRSKQKDRTIEFERNLFDFIDVLIKAIEGD